MQTQQHFPLGRLVATPGAVEAFRDASENVMPFIVRHLAGNWGEVDAHDAKETDLSVTRLIPNPEQLPDREG